MNRRLIQHEAEMAADRLQMHIRTSVDVKLADSFELDFYVLIRRAIYNYARRYDDLVLDANKSKWRRFKWPKDEPEERREDIPF